MDSIAITTAKRAVDYVRSAMLNDRYYTRVIHMDHNNNPLPFNVEFSRAIVVTDRKGKCSPSPRDFISCEGYRSMLKVYDATLVDYIIIGDDGFYSFADEKMSAM